jgi:anti-sigma regulatory factor (Ser/Thr protein kinase)
MSPTLSCTGSRHVKLAALPCAVPQSRRVLRHVLREWQLEKMLDPALLVTSELVANAVQASGNNACTDGQNRQVIALTVQLTDNSLLLEVWDASPALPVLKETDITGVRGRGLMLVDFLADAWGHRPAEGGKVIWCEVAIPARCPP